MKIKASVGNHRNDDLFREGPVRMELRAETPDERQQLIAIMQHFKRTGRVFGESEDESKSDDAT